jgi:hypothetical protein
MIQLSAAKPGFIAITPLHVGYTKSPDFRSTNQRYMLPAYSNRRWRHSPERGDMHFVNNIPFEKHCLIGYLVASLTVDANAPSMTHPIQDFYLPRTLLGRCRTIEEPGFFDQFVEQSFLANKCIRRVEFSNLPLLEDYDAIRVQDGIDTVRDGDDRPVSKHAAPQSRLQKRIPLNNYGTRILIENQNVTRRQEGAS